MKTAWPSTGAGRWSLGLLAGSFILGFAFCVAIAASGGVAEVTRRSMAAGGRFFSLPWIAWTLVAAAGSCIAAGIAALVAVIARRERSVAMVPPVLLGALVALFAFGEMFVEGK